MKLVRNIGDVSSGTSEYPQTIYEKKMSEVSPTVLGYNQLKIYLK